MSMPTPCQASSLGASKICIRSPVSQLLWIKDMPCSELGRHPIWKRQVTLVGNGFRASRRPWMSCSNFRIT